MTDQTNIQVSIGAVPMPGRIPVDLGPQHPSRAGCVGFDLEINNSTITKAKLIPGWLHRGAEKLFEVRTWSQAILLADRHDWLSSFSGELGLTLTIETAMGLIAPKRAQFGRTLLAELSRVHSHLAMLSFVPFKESSNELSETIAAAKNDIRELFLSISGNRVHPMLNRIGGLATDLTDTWLGQLRASLPTFEKAFDKALHLLNNSDRFAVAPLDDNLIDQFGLSGPTARALGRPLDLRFNPGYLAYPELDLRPKIVPTSPDALGRFKTLAYEGLFSLKLIAEVADKLPDIPKPFSTKLARIIKVPQSSTYLRLEAPGGIAGFWVVSKGTTTGWRISLRTPTFNQVAALEKLLIGVALADFDIAVASMGYSIGDLDK